MMFVSDLDQTLIYSKKFLNSSIINARLIETKDGEEISYMTEAAITKLKLFAQIHHFVPVTTRTIEQYKRISLFQHEIVPRYAVTSNGGNVLINGGIDKEWNTRISKDIDLKCLPAPSVLEEFSKIANERWVISQREADNLFSYFIIIENNIPLDELECFRKWLITSGWNMSVQGRKLYLVPDCVNKSNAICYVRELASANKVFAAGDSLLDLCMLSMADYAVIPKHSELVKTPEIINSKMHITKNSGILAAEDILDSITSHSFADN